ncbi:amidophosphoribosyltransferase [Leptotrichia sp. OH3620_COT-345]|uniref:amidophosphoribosyltransferase n=1 Tax=Leptotrichia sp. OH3620_COT-345 TaxID=2491048 RepID=UPI000F64CC33|nr:amidophosphoribosyltransferase [Leptotrichia sp. OH3620_COT-345]RRD39018.1 amidophosphoribosyltransferase [Leptotrichia sp. OH3620_COT-345]
MGSVKSADKIEEGGIFALYSKEVRNDLVGLAYYGMYALQHRGQESAGFSIFDTVSDNRIRQKTVKNKGLVADVFSLEELQNYKGNILVGHLKYSTEGGASRHSYQPLRGESLLGKVSIVHNGNLLNTEMLKRELMENGSLFQTKTDTEIILKLLGKNAKYGYKKAILNALKKLEGAFALAIIINNKLIGIRDPLGIRPLCLGKTGDGIYVLSSESCALDAIGANFVRDIEPGELVIMDENGLDSIKYDNRDKKYYSSFEYIYFARPDSVIDGLSVYNVRHESGRLLYEQNPIEADLVIGVPDSGVPAAIGYSEASGIPYGSALIKNKYIGRTFILPTQELREKAVRVKLNPMKSLIEGKKVVVVDDSLVRGTTSKILIKILFDAGAKEVHFRSASPVVINESYFGVNIAGKELIGNRLSVEGIRNEIGATSLDYLSYRNMKKALQNRDVNLDSFKKDEE